MDVDAADLLDHFGTKRAVALALQEKLDRKLNDEFAAPGGLLRFVEHFWPILEPDTKFLNGWALEAMALHLEATVDPVNGVKITRLLENVCPGSMKSLLLVFFTAWVWGPKGRPGERFLCMSYSQENPERDNRKTINLIQSAEFQRLYGKAFKLTKSGEQLIENDKTGFKQALGIRGSVTGKRASFLLCDDLNNIVDGESEAIRDETNRKFREACTNRLNDMVNSVIVVIQQRNHEDDVSGTILDAGLPYVHLMIPLLFEAPGCETEIGWRDPRSIEGECYWPERYPPEAVDMARAMGEFAFAGQYQQRPEPRGGGILKRDYWQVWTEKAFPECDYILASLDPAFTSKEENDPSGFTIWGCFLTKEGTRAAILLHAFRKKLELCGPLTERWTGETADDYRSRTQPKWGLVETVNDLCKRFHVDQLIVEAKGPGHSVVQTMAKLFANARYGISLVDPKRLDKRARMERVQPEFSAGMIWAPDKTWSNMVIDECAVAPRGKYDDLTDSTTQAIYHLRCSGFLERKDEQFEKKRAAMSQYKQPAPLYAI